MIAVFFLIQLTEDFWVEIQKYRYSHSLSFSWEEEGSIVYHVSLLPKKPTPEPYRIWPVFITSPRKKRQEQEEAKLLSWVGGKLVVFVCFCCCFSRGRRLYGHVFRQLTWLLVRTVRLGVVHHDPETGILKVINHFFNSWDSERTSSPLFFAGRPAGTALVEPTCSFSEICREWFKSYCVLHEQSCDRIFSTCSSYLFMLILVYSFLLVFGLLHCSFNMSNWTFLGSASPPTLMTFSSWWSRIHEFPMTFSLDISSSFCPELL